MTQLLINPFEGTEKDKPSELEERIETIKDSVFQSIVNVYEICKDSHYMENDQQTVRNLFLNQLTPVQINQFLQEIIRISPKTKLNSHLTGLFLSRLIMDSYLEGYNNFVLTTGDTQINNVGSYLHGTESNKIRLEIVGNVGDFAADFSTYSQIRIRGDSDAYLGRGSKHSEITTYGSTGLSLGRSSEQCIFTVQGNLESDGASFSKQSKYLIHGTIETPFGIGSDACTFITSNSETYKKMLRTVHETCTMQLINPQGHILKNVKRRKK